MALYHVTNTQEYLHSLGIDEVKYQLKIDAHSSTSDQSYFEYDGDTTLNFGTGGVPDAEDADHLVEREHDVAPLVGRRRRALHDLRVAARVEHDRVDPVRVAQRAAAQQHVLDAERLGRERLARDPDVDVAGKLVDERVGRFAAHRALDLVDVVRLAHDAHGRG